MRIVAAAGKLSPPLGGVPEVFAQGQAGLWTSRSTAICENPARSISVMRTGRGRRRRSRSRTASDGGRQARPGSRRYKIIFHQQGPASSGNNIGCRIVQAADGNLFVTLGDHFSARQWRRRSTITSARSSASAGRQSARRTIHSSANKDALPEIWAYGLRNAGRPGVQSRRRQVVGAGARPAKAATRSTSSRRARITAGRWSASASITTARRSAPARSQMPGMQEPVWHWTPSIAPSGMAFYTGDLFPGWKGSLFNGALKFELLSRLTLKGDTAVKEERLLQGLQRAHPRRAAGAGRRALSAHRQSAPAAFCASRRRSSLRQPVTLTTCETQRTRRPR